LFENVRINIDRINQTDSLSQCDVIISLVPFNKHDISPAIYFSDERNAFNVGVSLDYRNRNFLGGGRHFASSVRFQIQSLNLKKIPNLADTTSVGLVETDLRLEQPYLLGRKMPGQLGLSMTLDKQKRYVLNIVRNRLRFAYRAIDYSAYFDWDIESVNIKFQSQVDSTLAKLYPRQINSILSLTFQLDKVDDLLYPRSGYSYLVSVEEGGLFPFLFAQAGFKVQPFSQYYKLTFFYRRFFSLNNSVFGFKFKLGFANEYFLKTTKEFELSSIPINRRFFAGGSASVRGWRIRELGMVSNPSLGGKILIEANFENRTIVWRNLGFVLFLDAGNLWDEPRDVKLKYLAVAGGFGVRYLTFFGGLRFDFGFKVYDPGAEKKLIFNKTGLQILKDMIFHIGVGQTF
jgi:outer membrane protein assembly factor BamA